MVRSIDVGGNVIFIILALAALCIMASGGAIIILEILVAAGEADPTDSVVRFVLSTQPAWVTIPAAVVAGIILIVLSVFALRWLHNNISV